MAAETSIRTTAAVIVTARLRSASARAGTYALMAHRTGGLSCSETRPVMKIATAAGTKVTERIIAPRRAASTVNAIGKNIFPSMPVSVRIGR